MIKIYRNSPRVGQILKNDDSKNKKLRWLKIINYKDPILIEFLFLRYIKFIKTHTKNLDFYNTIINIYKNKDNFNYV